MASGQSHADFGLTERVPARELWDRSRPAPHDRLKWWLLGHRAEPSPSFIGVLEDPDPDRIGICCSGGGIRSASFNLGALQAIQKAGQLQRAKYLAAVSGGSYIAASISMVAKTWDPDDRGASPDDSDPGLVTQARPPFYEGSPEEQYLRNRASYLLPGRFDKVLVVWRIICGLIVNLLLIASVVALLAAALALYYRHFHKGLIASTAGGITAGSSTTFEEVVGTLIGFGLLLGIVSVLLRVREGLQRFLEMWSLYFVFLGVLGFAFGVVLPELIALLERHGPQGATSPALAGRPGTVLGGGIGATVASLLAAVLLQVRARVADPKQAIEDAKEANRFFQKLAPRVRRIIVNLATAVSGPLLLVALLVATTVFQVNPPSHKWLWLFPAIAGAIFAALYFVVGDLTTWSLHPLYRRRLCAAFALKRVRRAPEDDVGSAVERNQSKLVRMSQTGVVPRQPGWPSHEWPTLLVCAAANVSDPGATPPGRGVTSFTFSPLAMGGPLVGGVSTERFERKLSRSLVRDFTLPAAVAMSGAALAPSMGKLTRPSLRFLMGLGNVRLGVWVPNPRRIDSFVRTHARSVIEAEGTVNTVKALVMPTARLGPEHIERVRERARPKRLFPHPRPRYLLKELFGLNSINDKYLYVTDGGHYENLGLVELLRRGCMKIYSFDASGGKEMSALGDAIALARSELGVEIEFIPEELDNLREDENDGFARRCCAVGKIRYVRSGVEEVGTLVYARPVMTADLPWDVRAYKASDKAFPHHSTADQLFNDQKFEAYRVLGHCAAVQAMAVMDAATHTNPMRHGPGA